MLRKPAFWMALLVMSAASGILALRLFPKAFPLVQLELTMDRETALAAARDVMARERLGPADYRQAASFASDSDAQTFVELEGGGKEAYERMLREGLYAAYTWRVRHFREGEKHETLIRFRPDGLPYGFVEQLEEAAPGAALAPDQARTIAETSAGQAWRIDLSPFTLVEQSQERRPAGRIDHTITYERQTPTLNEGRYRLRLVVSGDRLTEASHFIKVPEAFTRRYEEMRSANQAIGTAGSVAMVLLYIVGGVGIGLFWLLRHRWVISRQPMMWGAAVALLQLLANLNNWPLLWMSYDTAVPRATFIGQQIVVLVGSFGGSALFFGVSFMAAESLGRRAFGHHPQLWRVWSPQAAASTTLLGQTLVGYLLVAVFFSYDVLLYFYATRLFDWWTPSEALLHPDVLAAYFPWLSAIANSLQAGFWEEALFRAVPIAGAALIGDRFGKRGLFIVLAFVIQSLVFGAGHAPYPTQPSYARPVELILPSIGFGLLYLHFGLLPGIVLHYAFDVVWFAMPLFVSTAPGIWIDRAMVVALTLVPLWVVLVARARVGSWLELPAAFRNAAWVPPPAPLAPEQVDELSPAVEVSRRFIRGWAVVGVAALGVWLVVEPFRTPVPPLNVSRKEAADSSRDALAARGFQAGPPWRVLPTIDNGRGPAHRFVWENGGEERFRPLLGRYLSVPRWLVRVATFEGDVAERAEEWTVVVTRPGEAERVAHRIPESRAAPSLAEAEARALAVATIEQTFQLPSSALREVSAQPAKLAARTDWDFAFQDLTIDPIPMRRPPVLSAEAGAEGSGRGEARIEVEIAGTEVARVRPFLHVPEEWEREQRGRDTLSQIVAILAAVIAVGALVTAAILGIVSWSRRQFALQVFVAILGLFVAASLVNAINGWPSVVASFSTTQPFWLQVLMRLGLGLVGLLLTATLAALAAGILPRFIRPRRTISTARALILGIALGLVAVAARGVAHAAGEPPWPGVGALASYIPVLAAATSKIPALVLSTVTLLVLLSAVDHATKGWTTRRVLFGLLLALAGAVLGGAPESQTIGRWLVASSLSGAGLVGAYVLVLRYGLSLTPIVVATVIGLTHVREGVLGGFPGALSGSLAGLALTAWTGWLIFRLLRRAGDGPA